MFIFRSYIHVVICDRKIRSASRIRLANSPYRTQESSHEIVIKQCMHLFLSHVVHATQMLQRVILVLGTRNFSFIILLSPCAVLTVRKLSLSSVKIQENRFSCVTAYVHGYCLIPSSIICTFQLSISGSLAFFLSLYDNTLCSFM